MPFIYLLGKEIANRRAGLLAMLFAGIAYWPNVISRVGLRFPLYPLFVAPTFYFLLRGLRTRNRNDFILSGLFLGLGLHGYTPFRIVPLLAIVTLILWGLYTGKQVDRYTRKHILKNFVLSIGSCAGCFSSTSPLRNFQSQRILESHQLPRSSLKTRSQFFSPISGTAC